MDFLDIQMFSGYVSRPLDGGREKFHICTGFKFAGHNLLTNHQTMITGEHLFIDKHPFDAARERSQPSLTLPAPRKRHDNRQWQCGMCELLRKLLKPVRERFIRKFLNCRDDALDFMSRNSTEILRGRRTPLDLKECHLASVQRRTAHAG